MNDMNLAKLANTIDYVNTQILGSDSSVLKPGIRRLVAKEVKAPYTKLFHRQFKAANDLRVRSAVFAQIDKGV